jgi:hypothetical protein
MRVFFFVNVVTLDPIYILIKKKEPRTTRSTDPKDSKRSTNLSVLMGIVVVDLP